jgi:hypothetical protein
VTVGITAAHVAWTALNPSGQATISGGADNIGISSDDSVFTGRDELVDCTIVFPLSPLPKPASGRRIRRVTIADKNLAITMHGSVGNETSGIIEGLQVPGSSLALSSTERVRDHFFVRLNTGAAAGGNSGSIIRAGNDLLGMVRAADDASGVTVVSQMHNVMGKLLIQP